MARHRAVYTARDRAGTREIVTNVLGATAVIALLFAVAWFAMNAPAGPAPQSSIAASTVEATAAVATHPPATRPSSAPTGTGVGKAPDAGSSESTAQAPAGSVVCIDAGHQAHGDNSLEPIGPGASKRKAKVTSGAAGVVTRAHESRVNLRIALKLKAELEGRGVKVVMVREKEAVNIPNSRRAQTANDAHAALFIRLHCDGSTNGSTHGISTLVPAKNRWTSPIVVASKRAGKIVHRALLAATGAADRGVVTRSDLSGFNWAEVPTVLVEMGFMSNRAEDRKLSSEEYQDTLAQGLAAGIIEYLRAK